MKKLIITACALVAALWTQGQEVTVFKSGEEGYASYRIPAIVKGKSGELIAFSEGRVDHAGDCKSQWIMRNYKRATLRR